MEIFNEVYIVVDLLELLFILIFGCLGLLQMLSFVVDVFVFVGLLVSDKRDEDRIVASSWDCLVLQILFKEFLPEGLG